MKTGIYVRVSTEEQAREGYSIRAQIEKLRSYALIKDWEIYDVYKDEGLSGKDVEGRPDLKRLLEDIENGKIENVLVYKIDRLTRSTKNLIELVELFNEKDCAFNSLVESIDTNSATGRMFLKIIGIFAEFERENIIERSRLGFERKAKEGYSLCTRVASYGYDKKPKKIQTINIFEAEIVKEIFDMFTNKNLSFFEIAKKLNERKISTKENKLWHARTVNNVLINCNYIGYVRYATKDSKRNFEVKGLHEPIISEELYYETQDIISKMSKKQYTKRPKEESYFLGFLVCAKCEDKFTSHLNYEYKADGTTKLRNAYRCKKKYKKICDACDISHKKMEKAFIEYISNISDLSSSVDLTNSEKKINSTENLINAYQKKLIDLEKKEKEILSVYLSGNIKLEDYMAIKKSIHEETEKIQLEIERQKSKEQEKEIAIKQDDIIRNLKDNWELLTNTEKRQFLIKFVDNIIVCTDNHKPVIKQVNFTQCVD